MRNNSYYTLVHKTVLCPMWKDNIHISAKYRYLDDDENPYLARFVNAECEVIKTQSFRNARRTSV